MLPGALSNELLRPRTEAINRGINNECQLVAPLTCECADYYTECNGTIHRWLWLAQLSGGNGSWRKEWIKVDAEEAGGDKPNKAEC